MQMLKECTSLRDCVLNWSSQHYIPIDYEEFITACHAAFTNAKKGFKSKLERYKQLCTTSQMVRNDLTTDQQHQLTRRVIAARKTKEIRMIAEGRGRKLKSDEFPGLAAAMEYVFGECNLSQGGGGLESHPRLTSDVQYRASDNAIYDDERSKDDVIISSSKWI